MWACANCRESVEDQFDACWKCGTSREGVRNLKFASESDLEDTADEVEAAISQHFICPKCKHRDPSYERIAMPGVGLRKLFAHQFLAVTCEGCGYTELFNLNVLEGRTDLGNFIRGIFGN